MEAKMETSKQPPYLLTRMLCEGAVLVVMAQILGYLKLWEMPWGGSISLSMLPIFVFACRWGVGPGVMGGLVFGVLQFMFDGGFALGWQSILGDYLVAFAVLGLAGLFRGKRWSIYAGVVVGSAARFLVHYVVGATVWAAYMPDTFFGMTMTSPWFYSLLYNGFYMVIDMVLCLVTCALLARPMRRYFLAEDIR
jgi:thiamine transporter